LQTIVSNFLYTGMGAGKSLWLLLLALAKYCADLSGNPNTISTTNWAKMPLHIYLHDHTYPRLMKKDFCNSSSLRSSTGVCNDQFCRILS
jgi:hypothetical protein